MPENDTPRWLLVQGGTLSETMFVGCTRIPGYQFQPAHCPVVTIGGLHFTHLWFLIMQSELCIIFFVCALTCALVQEVGKQTAHDSLMTDDQHVTLTLQLHDHWLQPLDQVLVGLRRAEYGSRSQILQSWKRPDCRFPHDFGG